MLSPKAAPKAAPMASSAAAETVGQATQMQSRPERGYAEYDIVLKPVSHPELGDISIDEDLFAIGRTEPPFASYPSEIVADLSRRHARIFCEYGAVYIADLDSKNGTTVNGVDIQQKISRLHDGDEICFGRALRYRVQLGARAQTQRRSVKLATLTLTPESSDAGLQPIVVTQFPFLISKSDETFARYKEEAPHQVHYLSRRHAHIFLKGGLPYVEDLGSTNGTFVGGERLDEHAVPLKDGDVVAFGGHHFVYTVSLQTEVAELDPTVTKFTQQTAGNPPVQRVVEADKTTFVAAADSFLDIFCVDQAPPQEEAPPNEELEQDNAPGKHTGKRKPRGPVALLLAQMLGAFRGPDRMSKQAMRKWGVGAAAVVLAVVAIFHFFDGGSEQHLKDLLAAGDYGSAVPVADKVLARDPDNLELQALGSQALLKAYLPQWLERLKSGDFDRAAAILNGMKQAAGRNPDAHSLVDELEWVGNLERFIGERGGPDAPLRIYGDEDRIKTLLKRWVDDTPIHQRALARVASYVPEFKDTYSDALSHLRRLQGSDAAYVAAIDRLKSSIAAELGRDHPEAIEGLLNDYADKYPRIGGLDTVRYDLHQYMEIDRYAREHDLGKLATRLASLRFATPPFQDKLRTLASSERFPPPKLLQQYDAVGKAWQKGDVKQAIAGLQKMAGGAWADGVAKELERKKNVASQFDALQAGRDAKGYDERLQSFYFALDPAQDGYFMKALEPDIARNRDRILKRAQDRIAQADALWRQYRDNGAIESGQRLDDKVTDKFRAQARLLSEANGDAQQGILIYKQLKADYPAQWNKLQDDIAAELNLQRKSLQELRSVLEPALLDSKLELLGANKQ